MIEFKKFPEIVFRGKKLVWDSRQPTSSMPERVYLNPSQTSEVRSALAARVGLAGERIDSESSLRQLGKDVAEALGYPSRQLKVIGVTGTNGKTSCTHILSYVLAAQGRRVLQVGTLGVQVWEKDPQSSGARIVLSRDTGFTTPEAPSLHDLFRQAVDSKITHVVMEVSSHALTLNRVSGVEFDVGVFTNLSQDHLDFHKTMEDYGAAKKLLFERELAESTKRLKLAVLGVPDASSEKFLVQGLKIPASVTARELRAGTSFEVRSSSLAGLDLKFGSEGFFKSRLIGAHNAWNLGLSFEALHLLEGMSLSDFESSLANYPGIPGRLERVGSHCFVDYAHTPDALEKTLETLRSVLHDDEKLVVVFGCGGDRDSLKRPLMGGIAARLADVVWITNDNPRTENPESILKAIQEGASPADRSKIRVCADRSEAIRGAIAQAKPSDVIAVCGKGHEDYQIIGTKKFPFSDQDCIRKCLQLSSGSPG